jgi:hypothetical protein
MDRAPSWGRRRCFGAAHRTRAVTARGIGVATGTRPTHFEHDVTRIAAQRAYEMAGLGPEDVSVAELHDASALAEILQSENEGLSCSGSAGVHWRRYWARRAAAAKCVRHSPSMRNKTDRNDARGIAQLMRLGWYKVVHVKSPEARRLRTLLGCRELVVRKLVGGGGHDRRAHA